MWKSLFFKSVLSSCSGNAGPVTRDPLEEQNTFTILNAATGIVFLFFRSQIHQCFYNVLPGSKFWDMQCKVHVCDWILNT